MKLVLRASLLRYCRSWVLELNENLILCPGLRKVPCPYTHLPKAVARLFWAEHEEEGTAEHTPRAGTHLAVPPASHGFVSKQGHYFSKASLSSGDLLLMFLWFPSSSQASKVSSTAVCKLREFSNCKPIAQRDSGSAYKNISCFYLLHLYGGTSSHCATQSSNHQHLKHTSQ